MDILCLFLASLLVFMMQPGFALLEVGLTSHRHSANLVLKCIVACAMTTLLFGTFGFPLMFADGPQWYLRIFDLGPADYSKFQGVDLPLDGIRIFYLMFAGVAATTISGAVAGRIAFHSYVMITSLISLLIFPLAGRLVWGSGVLAEMGILDFAGGIVVHGVGGSASLAAAWVLGPRISRQTPSGALRDVPGHSINLTCLGTFLLWFGWFGFNCGSVLEYTKNQHLVFQIFGNTGSAGAAALATYVGLCFVRRRAVAPLRALETLLAGLVSITAVCAYVTHGEAMAIGAVGAVLLALVSDRVKGLGVDDAVNAFAVHAVPGLWGALSISIFAPAEVVGDRWAHAAVQLGGGGAICIGTFAAVGSFCLGLKRFVGLRVAADKEVRGIDKSLHDFEVNTVTEDLSHAARLGDQSLAAAKISHEIMGALTAAKLHGELLEARLAADPGAVDAQFLKDRCQGSLAGLRRAETLARSTLSYAGRGGAVREDISLAAAVQQAIDMVRMTHKAMRVAVESDVRSDFVVTASEVRLTQAIYNILKNSIEAYPPQAETRRVRISLEESAETFVLKIQDEAGGLRRSEMADVGMPLVSGKAEHGGNGLGLFITREYLESVGMAVEMRSTAGHGTEFRITARKAIAPCAS